MLPQNLVQLQVLLVIAPAIAGWVLMLPAGQPLLAQAIAVASQMPATGPAVVEGRSRQAAVRRTPAAMCLAAHTPSTRTLLRKPGVAPHDVPVPGGIIHSTQTSRAP